MEKHVNREAWKPCDLCDDRESPCAKDGCYDKHEGNIDCSISCIERIKWDAMVRNMKFNRYCPVCGRPLTEEAWQELEKRVRGEK